MIRRFRDWLFGRRNRHLDVDDPIITIVTNAIRDVFAADGLDRICMSVTWPTADGGWVCDLPTGHRGVHMARRNGVVLNVWADPDPTPPHGTVRPVTFDCGEPYAPGCDCHLLEGHEGPHRCSCGGAWFQTASGNHPVRLPFWGDVQ